jgi:proline iminopeptidase
MVSQIAHNSQTSMVEVKTGLSLYTVELGNPDGAPMLVLHGGWGPAKNEEHRLDILSEEIRSKFRIIYFHQRGWGRSKIEEVIGTDTSTGIDANIADCEVLRQHFGIDKWAVVYGGSNGATLGLAYAAKYFGSTVSGLVLRGLWLIREQDLDHDYGDGKNGKGKYYPAQWRHFIGHVGYKTRADLERLKKSENPGLELVNKYWELMTGDSSEESQKAAESWLKWDGLGATVGANNANPPATSIELLTSNEDIVKLGLSFYKSLNSHASSINSKNFLETLVAKINGNDERVIESREELVRSLRKKIRLITGEFDMLCPPAFAYEVIEKLLESGADTDERTESESFTMKKTCQIVKGASHTQYDPGMPDAIQKAMLEITFGEQQ